MRLVAICAVFYVALSSLPAHAQDAASECAEGLSHDARLVFDAVSPSIPVPDGNGEAFVREKVRGLVRDGALQRTNARAAAEEARVYLQLLVPTE